MKIVEPTRLLTEAAEVLQPVREEVVIVGAAALEVALAEAASAAITPTRDVDVVVPVDRANDVIAHLEASEMTRSPAAHESGFTWIRGDLKVQLVRTFHPFPRGPARRLPQNPVFGMAADPTHQEIVAFVDDPDLPQLSCANATCLLALKEAAFGRTRLPSGALVERDFHDVYLLVSEVPEAVAETYGNAGYEVRTRALSAISQLTEGEEATRAAARQMVRMGAADSVRTAEAAVRREAIRMRDTLTHEADQG